MEFGDLNELITTEVSITNNPTDIVEENLASDQDDIFKILPESNSDCDTDSKNPSDDKSTSSLNVCEDFLKTFTELNTDTISPRDGGESSSTSTNNNEFEDFLNVYTELNSIGSSTPTDAGTSSTNNINVSEVFKLYTELQQDNSTIGEVSSIENVIHQIDNIREKAINPTDIATTSSENDIDEIDEILMADNNSTSIISSTNGEASTSSNYELRVQIKQLKKQVHTFRAYQKRLLQEYYKKDTILSVCRKNVLERYINEYTKKGTMLFVQYENQTKMMRGHSPKW